MAERLLCSGLRVDDPESLVGADPQARLRVRDAPRRRVGQRVGGLRFRAPWLERRWPWSDQGYAARGADPEPAATILGQRGDAIADQCSRLGIAAPERFERGGRRVVEGEAALARADPESAAGVFEHPPHPVARQTRRVVGMVPEVVPRAGLVIEPVEADARAGPYGAVARLEHAPDPVVRQRTRVLVVVAVGPRRPRQRVEVVQALAVGRDPQAAVPRRGEAGDVSPVQCPFALHEPVVVADQEQTLGRADPQPLAGVDHQRVDGQVGDRRLDPAGPARAPVEHGEALVAAEPEFAGSAFDHGPDVVDRQAVGVGRVGAIRREPLAVVPRDAALRAEDEEPQVILQQAVHRVLRQAIVGREATQHALRVRTIGQQQRGESESRDPTSRHGCASYRGCGRKTGAACEDQEGVGRLSAGAPGSLSGAVGSSPA